MHFTGVLCAYVVVCEAYTAPTIALPYSSLKYSGPGTTQQTASSWELVDIHEFPVLSSQLEFFHLTIDVNTEETLI